MADPEGTWPISAATISVSRCAQLARSFDIYLRKRDTPAICAAGSRSDVCARQPGQVRKEAATTGCGGSAGSLSFGSMSESSPLIATHWETPFEGVDADRLHLLRVDYPSTHWVEWADGRRFDFSEFAGPWDCEIWLFNEVDETVYQVCADIKSIRITDECDFPLPSEWKCKQFARSFRLTGSDMQLSTSSFLSGNQPSYAITTGNDCVEFLALNPPTILAVGQLRASMHQNLH